MSTPIESTERNAHHKFVKHAARKQQNSPQCCSSLKSLQSSCLLQTWDATMHFPLLHKKFSPVQLSANEQQPTQSTAVFSFEVNNKITWR